MNSKSEPQLSPKLNPKSDRKLHSLRESERKNMNIRFYLTLILLLACGLSSCTKEVTKYVAAPAVGGTQNGNGSGGGGPGGGSGGREPNPGSAAPTANSSTIEGTINGGGGKGVMCRREGKTTVETLDLYEARVLYGLKPVEMPNDERQALDKLINILVFHFFSHGGPLQSQPEGELERILRTDASVTEEEARGRSLLQLFRDAILKHIKLSVMDRTRYISRNQKLKATNDAHEPIRETNCEVVQIAVYYDESVLLVDPTLWEQMDVVNRISFYAHEWAYYFKRLEGAKTSIPVRKFIGHLLSSKGLRPVKDGVPTESDQTSVCRFKLDGTEAGSFYLYNSKRQDHLRQREVEGIEMVFEEWEGRSSLMRTSSFLEGYSLQDIYRPNRGAWMWWQNIDLDVDTYLPLELIKFRLNQDDNKGELQLKTRASTAPIATYEVECTPPKVEAPAAGDQGSPERQER